MKSKIFDKKNQNCLPFLCPLVLVLPRRRQEQTQCAAPPPPPPPTPPQHTETVSAYDEHRGQPIFPYKRGQFFAHGNVYDGTLCRATKRLKEGRE